MNNLKVIVSKTTGLKRDVVMVNSEGIPLYVEPLTDDEKLVEVGTYNDHVKPVYDEALQDFKESATPEEIFAARPVPQISISEEQKYKDMVDFLMKQFVDNEAIKVV